MSERKTVNKYFPPDFDPSKIPRRARRKDARGGSGSGSSSAAAAAMVKVRLMAPYSMRCDGCGSFIYKGKKFNARKEKVLGEDYLGISVFRFYIRCPTCAVEITFKTDPQRGDYVPERGAKRNFEPSTPKPDLADVLAKDKESAARAKKKADDAELDPMAALERRTAQAKRELELAEELVDLAARNQRLEAVSYEQLQRTVADAGVSGSGNSSTAKQEKDEEDELMSKLFNI